MSIAHYAVISFSSETNAWAGNEMTTMGTGCRQIVSGSGPKGAIVTDRLSGYVASVTKNPRLMSCAMALHITPTDWHPITNQALDTGVRETSSKDCFPCS